MDIDILKLAIQLIEPWAVHGNNFILDANSDGCNIWYSRYSKSGIFESVQALFVSDDMIATLVHSDTLDCVKVDLANPQSFSILERQIYDKVSKKQLDRIGNSFFVPGSKLLPRISCKRDGEYMNYLVDDQKIDH